MARKPAIPGIELLSEEEIKALRAQARAKVQEDLKKKASQDALSHFLKEEQKMLDPEEEMVKILIDVPGYADRITLDNQIFMHGVEYTVSRRQAETMREIMQNAWRHERTIGGANANEYRAPANATISGKFIGA